MKQAALRSFLSSRLHAAKLCLWIIQSIGFGFPRIRISNLVILEAKQSAPKYVQTLENYLLLLAEDLPLQYEFMQDGSPFHRAIVSKN